MTPLGRATRPAGERAHAPLVRLLLAGAPLLAGCASTPTWEGRARGEESAVYEAVIRYVAANYRTTAWNPDPAALCVAVGRREAQALAASQRSEDWDPEPPLMARLRRLEPPVLPISSCGRNRYGQEVRLDTDEVVLSVGVGYPEWSTPNLANVRVTIRESVRDRARYDCSVLRGVEGWRVGTCI